MRAISLLVLCLLGGAAQASDLTLNGQTELDLLMASPFEWRVTGNPGDPVVALVDVAPGPTAVFGTTLEIGITPSLVVAMLPAIPVDGSLELTFTAPNDPAFDGFSLYAVAGVMSGPSPMFYDWSNGVELRLNDRDMQLAGEPLAGYPHFEYVTSFFEANPLDIAVDPSRFPEIAGRTGDVYVVADKSRAEWIADPSLVDMTGDGAQTVSFPGGAFAANRFQIDLNSLEGDAGAGLGVPYDVVIDLNQNGVLDGDDFIDGYGDHAGMYTVKDTTTAGPYSVVEALYSGGSLLGQNLFYPSNIAELGELPLVVVSHGNGHNYQWYDHIGNHLASHGYVVMSHQNNTVPGIETASTTTLTNTDYFLGNLDSIEGGVLEGHIDVSSMMWIGHSRGGEGVARAYDRIFDGAWTPVNYSIEDIKLVSSIAPTNFLGPSSANPHDVPYHLWTGGSDADVNGCASNNIVQTFTLLGRALGERSSISLHGVGHGDFHNGGGSSVATGPCLVGRPNTHKILRGYILPLAEHHVRGNPAARDFLWRQWERFSPRGAGGGNPCVVVDLQHRPDPRDDTFVLDDFQSNAGVGLSSSGGLVLFTVANAQDGALNDPDNNFTDDGDAFNGFTEAQDNGDVSRGMVFEFTGGGTSLIDWAIPDGLNDVSGYTYLNLRAAQATRDSLTTAVLGDLDFSVVLQDGDGSNATIPISVYGGGIEEPYQRASCGSGVGWANEFETIRIRLTDFTADGSGLDLSDLAFVRLLFGPGAGDSAGRLGLDDLAFTLH